MKFTIYAQPKFRFTLEKDILDALIILSKFHYDLKCKMASMDANSSTGQVNGILKIWEFGLKEDNTTECVGVTWNDLDTLLKICEIRRQCALLDETMYQKLNVFVTDIYKVMDMSNKNAGKWTIDYNSKG